MALFVALLTLFADAHFLLSQQEFVKFGKKELYEQEKKEWQKSQAKTTYAVYDHESSQYLYLMPLESYADIGPSLEQAQKPKTAALDGTINFRILTLHEYLPACSYAQNGSSDFLQTPFLHYHIYGVAPGFEKSFEALLQKLAQAHKKQKSSAIWRVWKVLFDSDIPKYVICIFAKTKAERAAQVKNLTFVEPDKRELLRRDREGDAEMRSDLSIIP